MSERRPAPPESGPSPAPALKPFTVYVADNFHVEDEAERYAEGSYATYAEALVCKVIVDERLTDKYAPGTSAEALYPGYIGYGDDPFIVGPQTRAGKFSAWGYAESRCEERCAPKPATG